MTGLDSWQRRSFTHGEISHDTYRKGAGPGVVLMHEIPGLTPSSIDFGQELVDHGFTVVMPDLFGDAGRPMSAVYAASEIARACVVREFTALAKQRTAPVTRWLAALARDLHDELGGPGVGAIGMCFTGGYALAMMVDESVVAPVLAQPSQPFALTPGRSRDLGLAPVDLVTVKRRAESGCAVLGLRYARDPLVGKRFETLRRELGEQFIAIEFDGRGHSTLTLDRQDEAVARVLDFLDARLRGADGSGE